MSDVQIHNLVLPNDGQLLTRNQLRQRLQQSGLLQEDSPAIEQLSIEPGDRVLEGTIRGKHAKKLTGEFEELLSKSGYGPVAVFDPDSADEEDGYYAIQDVTTQPADPRQDRIYSVEATLTKEGTYSSHFRSIKHNITQLDHPFGNDTTAYVGVPGQADVRGWFDPQATTIADPTLVETRTGEFADVDIYDADAAPADHTRLLYSLPYDREWQSACRVWDTRGFSSKLDSGVPQWGRVFRTDHEYIGTAVLENGFVRIEPDEATTSLSVSTWDTGSSDYTSVSLGSSDWELYDWDTRTIAPSKIVSIVEFQDPTQSPTAYYTLRAILHRGYQDIQFDREGLESTAVPSGLQDLLDPVANTSIKDPGEEQILTRRTEVKG